MKKIFEEPIMEIIFQDMDDILTSSNMTASNQFEGDAEYSDEKTTDDWTALS